MATKDSSKTDADLLTEVDSRLQKLQGIFSEACQKWGLNPEECLLLEAFGDGSSQSPEAGHQHDSALTRATPKTTDQTEDAVPQCILAMLEHLNRARRNLP